MITHLLAGTALDSLLVTEEETSGDHHDRDKFLRNGGRGMSAEQVEIVEEANRLHIKNQNLFSIFCTQAYQWGIEVCTYVRVPSFVCHSAFRSNRSR